MVSGIGSTGDHLYSKCNIMFRKGLFKRNLINSRKEGQTFQRNRRITQNTVYSPLDGTHFCHVVREFFLKVKQSPCPCFL